MATTLASYKNRLQLQPSEPVRIALLLGLQQPKTMDDLHLADNIARGLPLTVVELINNVIPGGLSKLASESTLRRANSRQRLTRELSERIYDLSRVIDQAAIIFHGDAPAVGRFLTCPNPVLNNRTPFDIASVSSAGAHTVLNLLHQADAGVAI